ncbi:NTP transferase domain-containing protein [Candidatus Woesearchaeota archaeon]|nr:NTP transferase domain-containing protein [Candidatus Woesearchaeota archaeon]
MKAVILAAGKSTRTYPLTLSMPKPLLKISNKALIEHNLEQLMDLVDEAMIVIGYRGEMIQKYLGHRFGNIELKYVEQKKQLGTGHALLQAESYIKGGRFLVMMGDDVYFRGDIRKCLKYDLAVMVKRVQNYQDFGIFTQKGDRILELQEKPKNYISDLANTACYVFDNKIFGCLRKIKKSSRGELELTDGFNLLAKSEDIFSVEAKVWLPVSYPWNLLEADQIIRDRDIKAGRNTVIKGEVTDSSVGKNCVIEGFVKNSIIGDNVIIHKDSVIEDSIIGNNVEFRGTVETAPKVEIKVKGRVMKVENFGAAIGDSCRLKDVLLESGTLVWPKVVKKGKDLKGIVRK